MIKRVVDYHAPNHGALNLYKSLTRSIAESSTPVWSPQHSNELTQLESIQRGMTRFVTDFDGRSYQDRCINLNLLHLCFRREITDLVLFYKCLNKDIYIDNCIQNFDVNSSRRSGNSGILLMSLLTRTEKFKKSYFKRIVSEWNSLPLLIRGSSSLFSFTNKLMHHYATKLQQSFDVNNVCRPYLDIYLQVSAVCE